MLKKIKISIAVLLALGVIVSGLLYVRTLDLAVLHPSGSIAEQQRNLIVFASLLSIIVIVPVFVLLFTFARTYREGNKKKTKYTPDWDSNRLFEIIWWLIPAALIVVLSVVTWRSTHQLDPYKPIASSNKTMHIQVVAMDWKWLFIYPEQKIATVNYVQFPVDTPVDFEITSDAPMNSFWIPKLGGQIYAMSGMTTHLHLIADNKDIFDGSSANISGKGFAGMRFKANATSRSDFDSWLRSVVSSGAPLSVKEYANLSKPSENNPIAYYNLKDQGLYDTIVMKYMAMPHGGGGNE